MKSLVSKTTILLVFSFLFTVSKAQVGLDFDGVDDCVVATNVGPTGTSDRTIECWIKTTSTLTTQQVLVNWGDMTLGQRFTFNTIANGKVRIEIGGNGFNSNAVINDGRWHHLAVVYDHSATIKASIYIDGVLDTARNFTLAVNTTNTVPITIGKRIDDINYFVGEMDEIKIWDIALNTSQIRNSMFNSYCSPPANLVAYYKLEEGIANGVNTNDTIATDYSASNNDGVLKNFSLSSGMISNWVNGNSTITNDLDTNISQNADTLNAVQAGASYQWIDCNTNMPFMNDTLQSFVVPGSGSYAVALSKGSCVDTSQCYNVISVGVVKNAIHNDFKVYPSIFEEGFFVENDTKGKITVRILSLNGRLVKEFNLQSNKEYIQLNAPSGIYYLEIYGENGKREVVKLLKK